LWNLIHIKCTGKHLINLERKIGMSISYEVISDDNVACIKDLCNELMVYQKSKANIHPEMFDDMRFETRVIPSIKSAKNNFILIAKDRNEIIGYAYSNISPKQTYSTDFATLKCDSFFDFDSVKSDDVGCLSQFFIKEEYRNTGIGSVLFNKSMEWLDSFEAIDDLFIFVSNGNDSALKFYQNKGFKISHQILDGFITVLRNS
jgi:GNAT superfamily N-acetyltransferase